MTSVNKSAFKFWNSEYFVGELGNLHLKDGAPQDIIDDFKRFKEASKGPNKTPFLPIEIDMKDFEKIKRELIEKEKNNG